MRRNQKSKLSLKKETIANLGIQEMSNVHGGALAEVPIAIAKTQEKDCYIVTMNPCSTATVWNTCEHCGIIRDTIAAVE